MAHDDEELAGASYLKAIESPSDPRYNSDVAATLRDISFASDDIDRVVVVKGQYRSHIRIDPRWPSNYRSTVELAQNLARTYDKGPVSVEHEAGPLDSRVRRQGQPAQHTYYRDDRRERPPVEVVKLRPKLQPRPIK